MSLTNILSLSNIFSKLLSHSYITRSTLPIGDATAGEKECFSIWNRLLTLTIYLAMTVKMQEIK